MRNIQFLEEMRKVGYWLIVKNICCILTLYFVCSRHQAIKVGSVLPIQQRQQIQQNVSFICLLYNVCPWYVFTLNVT